MTYRVFYEDKFLYMDEESTVNAGEFKNPDDAIACAKEIVDHCLNQSFKARSRANALYSDYIKFGNEPIIEGPERVKFCPRDYARTRLNEMCRKKNIDWFSI